jgi:hypothetical protein
VKTVKAQATSAAGSKSGEATHYGGNTSGGTCSFTGVCSQVLSVKKSAQTDSSTVHHPLISLRHRHF